jgi:hypothetical protein
MDWTLLIGSVIFLAAGGVGSFYLYMFIVKTKKEFSTAHPKTGEEGSIASHQNNYTVYNDAVAMARSQNCELVGDELRGRPHPVS